MTTQHIVFEANMTRYEIVITVFKHCYDNTDTCMFVWLNSGKGGKAFVWDKGDRIYQSYASEKSDINGADLAGILSSIKEHDPSLIGHLVGFDENYLIRGGLNNETVSCNNI